MSQAIVHTPEIADAMPSVVTPMAMIDRALAMNANPDTLAKMMEMQERWEKNQARKAFDEAMANAKAEIPTIRKNRLVDYATDKGNTTYRHEDLAEIANTLAPILAKHGLSYRYRTASDPQQPVTVTCVVSHRLGHSEENTLQAGRDKSGSKNDIQALGSTVTYLQRYTLKAAFGLAAAADDDGHGSEQDEVETISPEQIAKVLKLIEETGSDIKKFCAYLKIAGVPEITVGEVYNRALDLLEAKRNAK